MGRLPAACHSEQKGCQAGMMTREMALISPNRFWRDMNGGALLSLSSVAVSISCPENLSTTLSSSNTFYLPYSIPNTHIFMSSLSPRDRNLILIFLYISTVLFPPTQMFPHGGYCPHASLPSLRSDLAPFLRTLPYWLLRY